jgi:hypothetical protein
MITLIIGLFLIANYSKANPVYPRVYDIKEELEIESGNVLDRGAITGNYNWEFTQAFSRYVGNNIEIVYIIEDGSLEAFTYDEGGMPQFLTLGTDYFVNGNLVNMTWEDNYYYFGLRQGKDFYFIISQHIGQDKYVAHN